MGTENSNRGAATAFLAHVRSSDLSVLFLPHAVRQMSRFDRMLSAADVSSVIATGELIEHYANDARGESGLLLGRDREGSPIHVVCAPKADYVAVITAYRPDPGQWSADFRTRVPE